MKWLILALLLIAGAAYASSITLNNINKPLFCADCHASEYRNYIIPVNDSDLPVHKARNITCIDCHSSSDTQSNLAAKKLLINAKLVSYLLPAFNSLLRANYTLNESFNSSGFSILKANCTKCHEVKKISSSEFNHSNASRCESCHLLHKEPQKPEAGFWKRMGEGGHRNRTCAECHGTEVTQLSELPQCTKCHSPHLKGAQWDRSTCLGCHNDPHLPVKNAVFKGTLAKETCSACHDNVYRTLTVYDSKHNKNVPSCTNCHPAHRQAKKCMDCHSSHGQLHSGTKCNSCHSYVSGCTDCHTNPHAPLSNLPIITGGEQWIEYARQAGKK